MSEVSLAVRVVSLALVWIGILFAVRLGLGALFIVGGLLMTVKIAGFLPDPWQWMVSTAATACILIGSAQAWRRYQLERRAAGGLTAAADAPAERTT